MKKSILFRDNLSAFCRHVVIINILMFLSINAVLALLIVYIAQKMNAKSVMLDFILIQKITNSVLHAKLRTASSAQTIPVRFNYSILLN